MCLLLHRANRPVSRLATSACAALVASMSIGCASYVTPAGGVSMQSLLSADRDIRERMTREPAAEFPARIAIVRVQDSGYRNYRHSSYGEGGFSVVTAREVELEEDFERIGHLPMVAGVVPLNRLVVPAKLHSDQELRLAAASLKADIVLVYSFDTLFRIDGRDIGPLGLVTLGFLPINEAVVNTTVSAAFFDVRTGYVYALAEASAQEKKRASAWTTRDAADDARLRAERKSFDQLLNQIEVAWKGIAEQYATRKTAGNAAVPEDSDR